MARRAHTISTFAMLITTAACGGDGPRAATPRPTTPAHVTHAGGAGAQTGSTTAPSPNVTASSPNETAPSSPNEPELEVFYARREAPCGREVLAVSRTPHGGVILVDASGAERPAAKLRLHALWTAKLIVRGSIEGSHDDGHCGEYPVLHVASFEPWGPVERIFSWGSADGSFHHYTENLPTDRFVPADFTGGPELPLLDDEGCLAAPASSTCEPPRVFQTNATGEGLCCNFLDGN